MIKTKKLTLTLVPLLFCVVLLFLVFVPVGIATVHADDFQDWQTLSDPECYQDAGTGITKIDCPNEEDAYGDTIEDRSQCYYKSSFASHQDDTGEAVWVPVECGSAPNLTEIQESLRCSNPQRADMPACESVQQAITVANDGDSSGQADPYSDTDDPAGVAGCEDPNSDCYAITHKYLYPAANLLSAAAGLIIVAVVIFSGIRLSASSGDPEAAAKAKKHITNAVVALIAFIFLWSLLNFLVPGGVL